MLEGANEMNVPLCSLLFAALSLFGCAPNVSQVDGATAALRRWQLYSADISRAK